MRPHRREPTRLPSLGFSRQEHWSGLPFPSPMHESEKWKWSRSVVSDSSQPHGLQPTRLLHPWDFPGKSTGVGLPVPSRRPAVFNGMESKKTGFPVHHQLLELAQTHIHQFSNAIQSPYPVSPSPPAFSLSQHQGLFQWISSSHQMARVLEFQLQHHSFQWTIRTDFL